MPENPRARYSRRNFLRKTAVGAAAVGVVAAVPSLVVTHYLSGDQAVPGPDGVAATLPSSAPLVAYVQDASRGEVVLMVGTQEVRRKDPSLVARLMHAMRSARV